MMVAAFKNTITLVWLILMGLTFFLWMAGDSAISGSVTSDGAIGGNVMGGGAAGAGLGARGFWPLAMMAIAFFKVRLVILHFMEIKVAPLALRLVMEAWVFGVCGIIFFLYLVPHPF